MPNLRMALGGEETKLKSILVIQYFFLVFIAKKVNFHNLSAIFT